MKWFLHALLVTSLVLPMADGFGTPLRQITSNGQRILCDAKDEAYTPLKNRRSRGQKIKKQRKDIRRKLVLARKKKQKNNRKRLREKLRKLKAQRAACKLAPIARPALVPDVQMDLVATIQGHKHAAKKVSFKTDQIALNISNRGFFGIATNKVTALWSGTITARVDSYRLLVLNGTDAKGAVQIVVDGEILHDTSSTKRRSTVGINPPSSKLALPYFFTKGKHTIDVTYVHVPTSNRKSPTEAMNTLMFELSLSKGGQVLSAEDARLGIAEAAKSDSVALYVDVAKTRVFDNTIRVNVADIKRPVVLLLNSLNPVRWSIDQAYQGQVRAVVISANKGSRAGDLTPGRLLTNLGPGVETIYVTHDSLPTSGKDLRQLCKNALVNQKNVCKQGGKAGKKIEDAVRKLSNGQLSTYGYSVFSKNGVITTPQFVSE